MGNFFSLVSRSLKGGWLVYSKEVRTYWILGASITDMAYPCCYGFLSLSNDNTIMSCPGKMICHNLSFYYGYHNMKLQDKDIEVAANY